ncbi:hypothetical protein [Mycolicibacterium brumae]|uniref:DNA-binding protein n=1 Tax=Mycolicibacterium brumae TaxID=85968 RepID=A0A2G5P8K5_9MYCO|nr:hypothetical protein [Mycolicibacterium brumae]MCV7194116.1 hypothetical protein [Mycolicibacterium brumae]PIB74430.1 hypothetical protein CQY22_013255 [Mycolicibacterium brumae]UWW07483.1 hypothetical protein L2Z93_000498 [Mycolicibacterium brumae]
MTTETSPRTRARAVRIAPSGLWTTGAVSVRCGVPLRTVQHAITSGRLPAYTVDTPQGAIYAVRPADARALWGEIPDLDLPAPTELATA